MLQHITKKTPAKKLKIGIICKDLAHFEQLKKNYIGNYEFIPLFYDRLKSGLDIEQIWFDEFGNFMKIGLP